MKNKLLMLEVLRLILLTRRQYREFSLTLFLHGLFFGVRAHVLSLYFFEALSTNKIEDFDDVHDRLTRD
jgi:hypothetical protein